VRLLNEPIDLIVLRHNIDDLYDCSNGRAYLYDTRKLKAKLKQEQLAGI
jgi:isocitrate dehydrogenase